MGCLGSLMLAMVTRVSCGHGGRALVADRLVWTLFWVLQLATVVRLAELAQLFGCELADFLRETSNRPTEQGIVLSQQLARLDDADRTLLLETVERLVERLARPG